MLPCPGVATSLIFSAAPLESVLRAQGCLVQTDSLLSRLKALKERIDATEAHVTLDLDHRRNQIVSFNLVSSVTSLTGASPLREILTTRALTGHTAVCHSAVLTSASHGGADTMQVGSAQAEGA